jgi:hypothetical protein
MIDEVKMRLKKSAEPSKRKNDKVIASDSTANNEEKAEGRRFILIKNSHFPSSRGFPFFLRWNPKSSLTVSCPNL